MYLSLFLSIFLIFSTLNAQILVLTSNKKIVNINKNELNKIYFQKKEALNDEKIVFLDNEDYYEEFCEKILGKTPAQVHAYWMKQIFLGHKLPPKKYPNKKIEQLLIQNQQYISYSSMKNENLKEVYISE